MKEKFIRPILIIFIVLVISTINFVLLNSNIYFIDNLFDLNNIYGITKLVFLNIIIISYFLLIYLKLFNLINPKKLWKHFKINYILIGVFLFFIKGLADTSEYEIVTHNFSSFNINPFSEIGYVGVLMSIGELLQLLQILLNIIYFIFLIVLFRGKLIWALPIIIECIQYIFKIGYFDINDIYLNYIGLVIGYLIVIIVNKHQKSSVKKYNYILIIKYVTLIILFINCFFIVFNQCENYDYNKFLSKDRIYFKNKKISLIIDLAKKHNISLVYDVPKSTDQSQKWQLNIYSNCSSKTSKCFDNEIQELTNKLHLVKYIDIEKKNNFLSNEYWMKSNNNYDKNQFLASLKSSGINFELLNVKQETIFSMIKNDELMVYIFITIFFIVFIDIEIFRKKTKEIALKKLAGQSDGLIIRSWLKQYTMLFVLSLLIFLPIYIFLLVKYISISQLFSFSLFFTLICILIFIILLIISSIILKILAKKISILDEINNKKYYLNYRVLFIILSVIASVNFILLTDRLVGDYKSIDKIAMFNMNSINNREYSLNYVTLSNRYFSEVNENIASIEEPKLERFANFLENECNAELMYLVNDSTLAVNNNFIKASGVKVNKNGYLSQPYEYYDYQTGEIHIIDKLIIDEYDVYITGSPILIFDYLNNKDKIKRAVKKYDVSNMIISFEKVGDYSKGIQSNLTSEIFKNAILLFVAFIMIIYTLSLSIIYYIERNIKKLALYTINNYSNIYKYRSIVVDYMLINLITAIIFYLLYQHYIINELIILIVFQLLISIIVTSLYYRKILIGLKELE